MSVWNNFYTSGAAWITQWQAEERARWANADVDSAANSAGRSAYRYTGDASLWGKPIPITWGTRRITGQLLQIGIQEQKTTVEEKPTFIDYGDSPIYTGVNLVGNNITWTPKTKFVSTFAYCFGQPGNPSARQILRKLWFNQQLVYDIDRGYLSPEIRFRFYQGDELQVADEPLNRERYTYPVAYRGLMYIVFYEYSIAASTGMGNPLVEAEFAEQQTNNQSETLFTNLDYGALAFASTNVVFDPKKNVYYGVIDGTIYKYSGATKALIDAYDITGIPDDLGNEPDNVHLFLRVANVPYLFFRRFLSNSCRLFMVNADTGVVADYVGTDGASLTPSLTNILSTDVMSGIVVRTAEGEEGHLSVLGLLNTLYFMTVSNGQLEVKQFYSTLPSGQESTRALRRNNSTDLWTWSGVNLYERGVLKHTASYQITQVIPSPFDETLVIMTKGAVDQVYKYDPTSNTVKWLLDSNNTPGLVTQIEANYRMWHGSFTAGQMIAWPSGSNIFLLNFLSGALEIIPNGNVSAIAANSIYDAYSNSFTFLATGGIAQAPILNQTAAGLPLATFLRNLAERQGYETANITVTGISDQVIGAVIGEVSDIDSILMDLKKAYNFEIIKRGSRITFSRRNYGPDFEVDATLTEADRALVSEDENEFVTVNSEMSPPGQTPGTVRLKYIDPDYNYTANEFIHKRNADNVDVTSELPLNLPIIMTGSDAAALAARVLLETAMNGVTHEFRLPQRYLAYEPGDVFSLEFDDYTDTVRAVEIAYNADWSMSVKSEAILTSVGPTYLLEPPILPPESPELIGGEGAPIIFDTTLIRPEDQLTIDALETYLAAIGSGRLPVVGATVINRSLDGQVYGVVGLSQDELTYGSVIGKLPPGPVLSIEYDQVIQIRLLQGDSSDFSTADELDVLAGTANRMLIGREGRWEQIGFIEASYDSGSRVVTLTGIIRGLRGTEIMAPLHQSGDYAVLIQDDSILKSSEAPDMLNEAVVFAVSDNVGRMNVADALALPIVGTTRMPWAVANVTVEEDAGDLDIFWDRRTRLSGPLNNGNPDVPLDEESELYDVVIYRAGSIVRTVENLTSPAYTYTAAQQAADGWSGSITSIQLDIYQISALVGRGFVKAGTYDVN